MTVKKDISEKVSEVVSYIKEHAVEGTWIVLTFRDIAEIINATPGSSTTRRVVEELRMHVNIIYTLHLDPAKGRKPIKYRYVSKEEKKKYLRTFEYDLLTSEEIQTIEQIIGHTDEHEMHYLYLLVNFLKRISHSGKIIIQSTQHISDILMMFEEDVAYALDLLIAKDLLIDEGSYYTLNLTMTTESIEEESLAAYIKRVEQAQKELNQCFEQLLEEERANVEQLQKKMDEGYNTVQQLMEAYQSEKETSKQLRKDTAKLEEQLNHSIRYKTDFSDYVQEHLQIFLWQVQQIALEDSRASISVKNRNAYRAQLAKQYTDIGQQFYEKVIEFSSIRG